MDLSGDVCHRLLACNVQYFPADPEDAAYFGFSAEDIGDYFGDTLMAYNRNFEAVHFISGENSFLSEKPILDKRRKTTIDGRMSCVFVLCLDLCSVRAEAGVKVGLSLN